MRPLQSIRLVMVLVMGLEVLSGGALAQADYVEGEILVCPAPEKQAGVLESLNAAGLKLIEKDAISGVLRVRVPAKTEAAWIGIMQARADVVYAELNGRGSVALVPNDTHFGSQWHLDNTGQAGGTPGADIEVVPAWDITTGSSSVLIAVLDSGIDTDHIEFAGRIDPDGKDFVNEDDDPEADDPHGTQVSGCICANANNAFGVTGVDWQCNVLPIKVTDPFGFGTVMDLAQGLNYVATQADVDIVSMSLQNYPGSMTVINALQAVANTGKILVACSGNGGIGHADVSFPGASPLTISVGATSRNDTRAVFSGTGAALDFVAPGLDIVTVAQGTTANTTVTVSGCSFATPITSGVVGLLLARAEALGLPPLTQTDVFNLLLAGAEDQVGPPAEDIPGPDNFFGEGRINALKSLQEFPNLLTCGEGNVGAGSGGPFNVLTINGSTGTGLDRTVTVGTGLPITFGVLEPPSNPAPTPSPPHFVIWGTVGVPQLQDRFTLPFGLGDLCFTPASISPALGLFTLANSFAAAPNVLPATPAPWSFSFPGLATPAVATLQGVIIDSPLNHVAVTNAVILNVVQLPPPTIASITPAAPTTAGDPVTITGTGFDPGIALSVGGNSVPPTSVTPTQVVFPAPAMPTCDTAVVLTNPDSQTAAAALHPTPTITNLVTPQGTPAAGGTALIIIGSGFVPGTTVTIGGNPVTVTNLIPTAVIATSPPGNVGSAVLVVTTPLGCSVTSTYTYTL